MPTQDQIAAAYGGGTTRKRKRKQYGEQVFSPNRKGIITDKGAPSQSVIESDKELLRRAIWRAEHNRGSAKTQRRLKKGGYGKVPKNVGYR